MNWLNSFVRPKIRALVEKPGEQADVLWEKCGNCGQMVFHRELTESKRVCPNCGHHLRLGVRERLELIFDQGSYDEHVLPEVPSDPLKFRDQKRYSERLRDAQTKTGRKDALVVASGSVEGHALVVAAFDFSFMGGSMGTAVGEGFLMAARLAVLKQAAFLAIPASGGARMQEGILSLMQMPRTTIAVQLVREAGLPYLVLLTDPTTGGVTASFAMLGDVTLAEPGAVIGFAGQRVIEETIRETLPEGFQRSEYLLEHGMVDLVVRRSDLKESLARLIGLLTKRPRMLAALPSPTPQAEAEEATVIDGSESAEADEAETAPEAEESQEASAAESDQESDRPVQAETEASEEPAKKAKGKDEDKRAAEQS